MTTARTGAGNPSIAVLRQIAMAVDYPLADLVVGVGSALIAVRESGGPQEVAARSVVGLVPGGDRELRDGVAVADRDGEYYLRQEGKGLLVGAYEKNLKFWAEEDTPQGFGHELFADDLERIEENMMRAIERVPAVGEAGIKRVINGPMIWSPDSKKLAFQATVDGRRGTYTVDRVAIVHDAGRSLAPLADALGIASLLACLVLGVTLANVVPEEEVIGHTVF